MFEKYKAKKAAEAAAQAAKRAEQQYQVQLAKWTEDRNNCARMLQLAQGFNGEPSSEIILKSGEALFLTVTNTALIEERRGQGHYEAGSTGVSVPIGSIHGRSIRYRVGATRGHFVQGTPVPTAIDTGTTFITNQRVVFAGGHQTRECDYTKLIGVSNDVEGESTFSVSNRQKPTTIHYGTGIEGDFRYRLELALAHYKGTADQLVSELQNELAQIDAGRPPAPAPIAPQSS